MRVRCITNVVDKLPDAAVRDRLNLSIHREGPDEDLVVGQVYHVVAIARWRDNGLRVYLHTINESHHPYPYPLEMFEVVDPSLPTGWCVNFEQQQDGLIIQRISFPEWASDDQFFERLVDGDETAITIYQRQH